MCVVIFMSIKEMEEYAKINNVPIMEKEGIEFLTKYIKENNIKNILEIGTAIGYSAIRMCLVDDSITVTTIERDKIRYDEAIKNIKAFNMEDRINVIFGDALEVEVSGEYDLIFIDAAKSQSIKFFNRYEKLLKEDGTIITDNINFHGLTFSKEPAPSRNLRQMIRKIHDYLDFLKDNKEYTSRYENIGDGLMISKRV
jgi:predicted O-methyltransferase YrrM